VLGKGATPDNKSERRARKRATEYIIRCKRCCSPPVDRLRLAFALPHSASGNAFQVYSNMCRHVRKLAKVCPA
jgi:hypothetical protein